MSDIYPVSNHRFNPFTGKFLPRAIMKPTPDTPMEVQTCGFVEELGIFGIAPHEVPQAADGALLEVPQNKFKLYQESAPGSGIFPDINELLMVDIGSEPDSGQFKVDFLYGTGLVQMNAADVGLRFALVYDGLGTVNEKRVITQRLDDTQFLAATREPNLSTFNSNVNVLGIDGLAGTLNVLGNADVAANLTTNYLNVLGAADVVGLLTAGATENRTNPGSFRLASGLLIKHAVGQVATIGAVNLWPFGAFPNALLYRNFRTSGLTTDEAQQTISVIATADGWVLTQWIDHGTGDPYHIVHTTGDFPFVGYFAIGY